MNPVSLWESLVNGRTIERVGVKEVGFESAGMQGNQAGLPDSIFQASSCQPSVGMKEVNRITGKLAFESFSARSNDNIPSATACMVFLHEK